MMERRNRMLVAALVLCLFMTLCGCSLAIPEAGEAVQDDRFIGFFITKEACTSPLEAECVAINDSGIDTMTYEFPVEGLRFFNAKVNAAESSEAYHTSIADNELSHVQTDYSNSDIIITGTLYADFEMSDLFIVLNLVYQRADGSVYMLPGQTHAFNTCPDLVLSVDETYTATENDEETTATMKAEVFIKLWTHTETYNVYFMSEKDEIIASETYTSADCPDNVTVPKGCEWLFITGYDGARTVLREALMFDNSEASYDFFFPGDWSFAIGHSVSFSR